MSFCRQPWNAERALLQQLHIVTGESPRAHCRCGAPPWHTQNSSTPPLAQTSTQPHASAAQHAQPAQQLTRLQADSLAWQPSKPYAELTRPWRRPAWPAPAGCPSRTPLPLGSEMSGLSPLPMMNTFCSLRASMRRGCQRKHPMSRGDQPPCMGHRRQQCPAPITSLNACTH